MQTHGVILGSCPVEQSGKRWLVRDWLVRVKPDIKPEWKLEGVNLLPFLKGEKIGAPHDALNWRFGHQMAIRAGDYKLVRYDSNADTLIGARNQPVTAAKLYHLTSDIGETQDLAATQPGKVRELQAKWDAWNAANEKPRWGAAHTDNDGAEPVTQSPNKAKKAKRAVAD